MSGWEERLVAAWGHRGVVAVLLWPLSALMAALVGGRRWLFMKGLRQPIDTGLPVLVVGNRVVGGAGKTPTTIAIVRYLQSQGWRPGVLSRGYGRAKDAAPLVLVDRHSGPGLDASEVGDEPLLIWRRTSAPLMVGRDRPLAARQLRLAHPDIDILVCDDGLQHLALRRDIEVVVFDERGAGNGWLLPAGPLREPLAPPSASPLVHPPIVLYNATTPSTPLPGHCVRRALPAWQTLAQWWGEAPPGPDALSPAPGSRVWAVAGIAHPSRFFGQLVQGGWQVMPVPCADHATHVPLPWPQDAADVVLTEKDAIKIRPQRVASERPASRVWVAAMDFQPDEGFWRALDRALARLPRPPQPLP